MKKTVFIAALAIVAMASCTKNELKVPSTGSDAVISFQPVVANATKATYLTTANMKTACPSFGVFAWYAEPKLAADNTPTLYMDNVTVEYSDAIGDDTHGNGAWAPDSPYYWPKNGTLSFDAYAPASAHAASPSKGSGKVSSTAANGLTIENYTVADLGAQYDLLYSTRTQDKKTSTGGNNDTYDGVDIAFKHALAAIVVTAKTHEDYSDAIKLKKITILNAYNKGDFSQGMTNATTEGTAAWTPDVNSADVSYDLFSGDQVLDTDPTTPVIDNAILLPQSFVHASDTVSIKVDYSIKHGDNTYLDQTQTFVLSATTVDDESGDPVTQSKWEMGKRYTYNFIFSLENIYFAPKVEDWKDVTVNDIDVK